MTLSLGIWTRLHETLPLFNRIFAFLESPGNKRCQCFCLCFLSSAPGSRGRPWRWERSRSAGKGNKEPRCPNANQDRLYQGAKKHDSSKALEHLVSSISQKKAEQEHIKLVYACGDREASLKRKNAKTSPSFVLFAVYSSCLMCSLDPTGGPVIFFKFDDMAAFASFASFAVFAKYSCSH